MHLTQNAGSEGTVVFHGIDPEPTIRNAFGLQWLRVAGERKEEEEEKRGKEEKRGEKEEKRGEEEEKRGEDEEKEEEE